MAKCLIASDRTIRTRRRDAMRMNDGNGLHLRRGKDGLFWYQDVSYQGKRFTLSLGPYPEIGLAAARELSVQMRTEAFQGVDLYEKRKSEKEARRQSLKGNRNPARPQLSHDSFGAIARSWYDIKVTGWSEGHAEKVLVRLEKHLFPVFGGRRVAGIECKEITELLMQIDAAGKNETAQRVLEICRRVFDFAVARGHVLRNPCVDIKEILRSPVTRHHAAITKPAELAEFVHKVDVYSGSAVVCIALKLALMTFLRSSEFRWAHWEEFDLDRQLWLVPAARMKQSKQNKQDGSPHRIHLSTQAVALLRDLRAITGTSDYVFPGQGSTNPVMSENTINKAIRNMGFSTQNEMSFHGFRATARTMLVEYLNVDEKAIELQLGHSVPDANGDAYNRAELEFARRELMQKWSDYLESLMHMKSRPHDRESFKSTSFS